MKQTLSLLVNLAPLLIIAVFCGFMLCIYTAHLPFWKQIPPENFLDWFSTYSGGISNGTGPLGILSLVILPLITLILTWNNSQ